MQRSRPITIVGAKTNTLKNITVQIPEHTLTVITGVSGSGKSSLAFQTLFAEGQNRFVECLGTYARQFIESQARPDVEAVYHVRPAIAIKQENRIRTNRSTVGTMTEIVDYLRILFARVGKTTCFSCGQEVKKHTRQDVVAYAASLLQGHKIAVLFPFASCGYTKEEIEHLGFTRGVREGREQLLAEMKQEHPEYIVYERMTFDGAQSGRFYDALTEAFHYGKGQLALYEYGDKKIISFSDLFQCDTCHVVYTEPTPHFFSFNSPLGACPTCEGHGDTLTWDEKKVIPDPQKSVFEGAVDLLLKPSLDWERMHYYRTWEAKGMPMRLPYKDLDDVWKKEIWTAVESIFAYLEKKKYKMHVRVFLSKYRAAIPCHACSGSRLRQEVAYVRVGGYSFMEYEAMSIRVLLNRLRNCPLSDYERAVASTVLDECIARLAALDRVGLAYLTLDRKANSLSGGEAQRVRLASAVRSGLSDVLYVLDEPTIGLHPQNTQELLDVLCELRDLGNTIVVVEHDAEVMKRADYIIDMGPGSGEHGGEILYAGTYAQLLMQQDISSTASYLSGTLTIQRSPHLLGTSGPMFISLPVTKHTLKDVMIQFPQGTLISVVGMSGSGKSTLMEEVYKQGLDGHFPGTIVRMIDQEPIGRNARSVPVTYLGFFDPIRQLFAGTAEAKKLKLTPGHFSFNSKLGQCPHCEGHGERVEEMYFLNDMVLPCEVCEGSRYKAKVLKATYGFRTIADVLAMTVTQAQEFFIGHKKIQQALRILTEVGLGYVRLGQSATTFSGGEAQRFKIAQALLSTTQKDQKNMLYIMDEPTTGLHFKDIQTLLTLCETMVAQGATIVMVEHNVDIIKASDWIIEMGPGAGDDGGKVIFQGTFSDFLNSAHSVTKKFCLS